MTDWTAVETQLNDDLIASALAEPITYTPHDSGALEIRAIFDIEGWEVEPETGIRVATGRPKLSLQDSDLGRAPEVGDEATISGVTYRVQAPTPSGRGWSRCELIEA